MVESWPGHAINYLIRSFNRARSRQQLTTADRNAEKFTVFALVKRDSASAVAESLRSFPL